MNNKTSFTFNDFWSVVVVIVAIYLVVSTMEHCRDTSIKARAYEKVKNEGMSPDDALEEAEYERDLEDEAAADSYHD